MQQNNRQSGRNHKSLQGLLPWIVIGVIVIIALGVLIIPSFQHEAPPQPTGQMHYPRVHLTVQSNVGGAEVYLDGKQRTIISDTHRTAKLLNLARKTHQITLKKQGYADRTESVEITGKTPLQTVQIDMQSTGEPTPSE